MNRNLDSKRSMSKFHQIAQIGLVSCHEDVYEPCADSFALVDALLSDSPNLIEHHPLFCVEIGSGSGYVITSLAIMLGHESPGTHYFATDLNLRAAETTRRTLDSHGVHAELLCTDITSGLMTRLEGSVDVVIVNPPYVPTPDDEVGCGGISAAWAGGENGRAVIDRILPQVDILLSQRGWLYMVTVTANNPSQICRAMREKGYSSRIMLQRSTEEESLQVIKFWRDPDLHFSRSHSPRTSESWLSQFSVRSLWRSSSHNGYGYNMSK